MKKTLLTITLSVFVFAVTTAQTTFGPKQTINSNTGNDPYAIASGFIDGDAYADIIVGTTIANTLVWYKNNGNGTFTAQPNITNTISFISNLMLVDLNNDTFLDLLVTAYSSNSVTWYANDGNGNFGAEQSIGTVNGASGLSVGTIDGDATIDVAVTSYDNDNVVWFANNGAGVFGSANTIDNTLDSPGTVFLKDIDGDTDLDALISTSNYTPGVNVLEIFRNNLVGSGTVSFTKDATSVVTGKNNFAYAIFEDVDGDSNLDILASVLGTTAGTGSFSWYEDNGVGFTETPFTTSLGNPSSVIFADLDNDTVKDIVLSNGTAGPTNQIVWFKNNGSGSFAAEAVIDATQSNTFVMTISDFENDGDLDIASLAYNQDDLNWFENLKFTLGTDEFSTQQFSIYPNPAKNSLNFKGFNENLEVSVFDILGKQVMTTSLSMNQSLDISGLNNGMYILKFEGINSTFKFIKQ